MTRADKIKLLRAGFRIIRADDQPKPRIKEFRAHVVDGENFVSDGDYYTLERFDTKAARDRAMRELLMDEKTVED